MGFYIIPAAFVLAVVIVMIYAMASQRPVRGLWIFVFIIFLATWSGQLWITPFGPSGWGITWLPFFLVPLFFSLLIFAIIPKIPEPKNDSTPEQRDAIALSIFFWGIFIMLIAAIVAGYFRAGS